MSTPTPARAVAIERNPGPLLLARPAAWALGVTCVLGAIQGVLRLRAAEGSFSEFGLEKFGLGAMTKASIRHDGFRIGTAVLLALAACLMHFRRASFASPQRGRALALRITGLVPVFVAAATTCLLAAAAALADEHSSMLELIGSADLVAVAIILPLRMALLGSIVAIASPLLSKEASKALLVGKLLLLWFVQALLWFGLASFLHEVIPGAGVSP